MLRIQRRKRDNSTPLWAEAEPCRVQRIQSKRERDNSTPYGKRQSRVGCKGYRVGEKEITVSLMGRGRAMAGAKDTEREES